MASCASVLLVSVTNHMSQNVAPIPLLWVLPLALYLLTFIFAFESDRIYRRWLFIPLLAPALLAALVVTETFASDHRSLVVDARSGGVAAAGIAIARRAPLPVVVLVAAAVTAALRAL